MNPMPFHRHRVFRIIGQASHEERRKTFSGHKDPTNDNGVLLEYLVAIEKDKPQDVPSVAKAITSRRITLADPHQVNTIIASAICDCRKNHPDGEIAVEEAKQIAKCVVEHLSNAGFTITHQDDPAGLAPPQDRR